MPNLTHHQFEELFESAGAKLLRDMNMHRCQQNRTLIPFMLMTRTRSEGPMNSCEQVATSDDDADGVDEGLPRHSQRTSRPLLRMTYDAPGQLSFQPWTNVGVQGNSASYPQHVATCVETLLSMFCLHVPLQFGPMTRVPN